MNRPNQWPVRYTCVLLISVLMGAGTTVASDRAPNVLFILADDLGWSDTTLYGTTEFYRTPNIQRLAERGMTFTRAYSASPLCSPTRASILTGMAPARHGITAPQCHLPLVRLAASVAPKAAANRKCIQPDSITRLDPASITIAETLHQAGYVTGHFGKWHLGAEPYSPLQHGFDVDIPHWHGPGPAGSYVAPWKFKDFDHDPDIPNEHIEDRMAREAIAFMQEHRDKPFFLNYWMFSVHAPFDAKKELIDHYRGRVNRDDAQRCPTYAAMIESMDDAVGTLLDELDRLEIADQTIIVFASDNGGNAYSLVDGERPTSNRPLRGGKATMYEGGLRTPAIIVWPGQIEAASTSDAMIQSMDYYPTLLEMLDLPPAAGQEFDGVSLVPAFQGKPLSRDAIFTYFPHNPPVPQWLPPSISVHSTDWKLIRRFHDGSSGAHRYLLFNLREDPGERRDLAAEYPDQVLALDAMIESHLTATHAVVPQVNPAFDATQYDESQVGKPAAKFVPNSKRNDSAMRQGGRKPRAAVAGWRPGGTSRLTRGDGYLRVESTGGDPYLSFSMTEPLAPGEYTLRIRMRSDSNGRGQVFWRSKGEAFNAERSVRFTPNHDKQEHDYSVSLTTEKPMDALRIDPSTAAGTIDVVELQLLRAEQTIRAWRF